MELEDHYGKLLGVESPWEIASVDLKMQDQRVDIVIEYSDDQGACPECGAVCPKHDNRKKRTWRHLDTMQFSTYLHCEVPRILCETHGAKTLNIPWAGKHSRFTLLFEAFAIRVLTAARSVEEATIRYLGIDEKQFRSGHRYISNLYDLDGGRVLEVVEERTESACNTLIEQALTPKQQINVTAVALDMWKAYANAVTKKLPQAVDAVRRQENKTLIEQGDERLKGSKFSWLANEENVKEKFVERFNTLKHADLKVARAWAIKELFRDFWSYTYAGCAERHFNRWYSWAIRSRLAPIKAKARMIKSHLPNILTYFKHPITNAVAEGLNSKIQTVKANARGYRSFKGFRNSILFYCGGLDMAP